MHAEGAALLLLATWADNGKARLVLPTEQSGFPLAHAFAVQPSQCGGFDVSGTCSSGERQHHVIVKIRTLARQHTSSTQCSGLLQRD